MKMKMKNKTGYQSCRGLRPAAKKLVVSYQTGSIAGSIYSSKFKTSGNYFVNCLAHLST